MKFVHLHTHSHYSLLDGLAKIDQLIERAKELKMDTLALTDHGNLYGAIEFYKKAKKEGIKPILGVEAYIAPKSRFNKGTSDEAKYYHLTLLAKNNIGWKNLLMLVTKSYLEGFYYKPRIDKEILKKYSDGLIALSGCPSGEISRLLQKNNKEEAIKVLKEYKEIFGDDFYMEIWQQPKLADLQKVFPMLIELAKETKTPIVATQDIHYIRREDSIYHEILLSVQTQGKIEDGKRLSMKNGDFSMRTPDEMIELFKEYPEAIENTEKIAEKCNVEIKLGGTILPELTLPENETEFSYLEKLVNKKISGRFAEITQEIKDRVSYELSVIEKTGFAGYFLIVQDFISWAKERKIVVGPGRGSAAGSIISYILGITEIDPIKYDLLFERFLNPERIEMPDIDTDITDLRRDEVVGYLKEKYGEDHVAQIITFGTMMSRAAIRDTGRAMGFSYSLCDEVAKTIPFNYDLGRALDEVEDLKKKYNENSDVKKLVDSAKHLEGVARHASVHACGIVISKEPLTEYMPLQFAPQDQGTIISQFEMDSIGNLGLLKMDILGLKNLTIIEETIKLVREIKNINIDILKIPLDDQKVFKILQQGDTTGVFQLESSGMRRYLKELKPTELEDIVAMVALYRPGPMELIPRYIARKHGKEGVEYLHPKLESILGKTYGIGVYQEQMMKIAHEMAGLTLPETDTLRKAIGKKIKELLDKQEEKLVSGMIKNGIDKDIAKKVWDLFPPFARYGFNRSHAVCYATIAYQTAYLKTYFPVEFMTSLMNADIGDIDRTSFLVSEIKKMKIKILPPDINMSYAKFTPEGNDIRFGLEAIKNVGSNIVAEIITQREHKGRFSDFGDFLFKVLHKDLNKKSLESLIKSGSFDNFGISRMELLKNLDKILSVSHQIKKQTSSMQNNLFGKSISPLKYSSEKETENQNDEYLAWEKELLGFYVSKNPMRKFEKIIKSKKAVPISKIIGSEKEIGENLTVRVAGIIGDIKKIITKNKSQIAFVKLEDETGQIEIIVFSRVLSEKSEIFQKNNVVIVQGKISKRDGAIKIVCDEVVKLNN